MKIFCWNSAILIINLMIWFFSSVCTPTPVFNRSLIADSLAFTSKEKFWRGSRLRKNSYQKCNSSMLIDSLNVLSTSSCVLIVWAKARLQEPNMMSFSSRVDEIEPDDLNSAKRSHPLDIVYLIREGSLVVSDTSKNMGKGTSGNLAVDVLRKKKRSWQNSLKFCEFCNSP